MIFLSRLVGNIIGEPLKLISPLFLLRGLDSLCKQVVNALLVGENLEMMLDQVLSPFSNNLCHCIRLFGIR